MPFWLHCNERLEDRTELLTTSNDFMEPIMLLGRSPLRVLLIVMSLLPLFTGCGGPTDSGAANNTVDKNEETGSESTKESVMGGQAQNALGNWQATSAVMAGTPFEESLVSSITLAVSEETYETSVGGQPDCGTCELDRTTTPYRMLLKGTEGPNKDKTMLAIFDFPEPGQMRVAYDITGKAYPTDFESSPENGIFVATYQRREQ